MYLGIGWYFGESVGGGEGQLGREHRSYGLGGHCGAVDVEVAQIERRCSSLLVVVGRVGVGVVDL